MSELHDRLAHLVNYSSQLIFVSGDTVADQQRTLNDFLSSQQENTEISFLAAQAGKPASEYRSAICRQLAGHTVGSFVRPLNQLLTDLSPESGPYLLCITAADLLDPSFLQELWDWVMRSQQTEHNIHLNIILFGKADWAESSQEWLPSQNSHKPVLLSSQSVNSSGFDVNALEALMANERSLFNLSSGPIVTNKWFISSVLSVFLAIFIGLISWQYPAQITQFIASGTIDAPDMSAFDVDAFGNQNNPLEPVIVNPDILVTDVSDITNGQEYMTPLEIIEPGSEDLPLNTNEINNGAINLIPPATSEESELPIDDQSVTDSLLVSTWEQGTSTVFYNAPVQRDLTAQVQNQLVSALTSASTIPAVRSRPTVNLSSASAEGDFQVPDIISIEQLDQKLGNTLNTQLAFSPATESTNDVVINSLANGDFSNNTTQTALASNSSIDYRFDETTLLSLPTDEILLQLSGIQNPVVLESYLASNDLKASTWVYQTERYGGPWYVVLYRQSFGSIDAALNLMSSLPEDVKNAEPFAKSVNQIQQEIRRR